MRERRYIEEICVGLMRKVAVLPRSERLALSRSLGDWRGCLLNRGKLSAYEAYLNAVIRHSSIVNSVEPV